MIGQPSKIIRLKVHEISKLQADGTQYLLILKEVDGKMLMPVLLDKREAEDLLFASNREPKFHAPWTRIMKSLGTELGFVVEGVILTEIRGTRYMAQVQLLHNGVNFSMEMDAIQAIIMALAFRCPIFIEEALFAQQHSHSDAQGTVSLPISTLTLPMLEDVLRDALRDENYELASHIRDEIKRRR